MSGEAAYLKADWMVEQVAGAVGFETAHQVISAT
jgi:hypothetical protein